MNEQTATGNIIFTAFKPHLDKYSKKNSFKNYGNY
jgi:hypothetical protein